MRQTIWSIDRLIVHGVAALLALNRRLLQSPSAGSVTHALIITLCSLVALSTSRHFGTGPELSWDTSGPVPKCPDTSGPVIWYRSVLVPKCPGTEVSWHPGECPASARLQIYCKFRHFIIFASKKPCRNRSRPTLPYPYTM